MLYKKFLSVLSFSLIGFSALTLPTQYIFGSSTTRLLSGDNLTYIESNDFFKTVSPGDIVIIGEQHGTQQHSEQQLNILNNLRNAGYKVSVALEFFEYPKQNIVDQWIKKEIDEATFLNEIEWKNNFPFQYYKDQALFPNPHNGEKTIAINAPRSITKKVSKLGLSSLTPEERLLIPKDFKKGTQKYFERFSEVMGEHVDPDSIERYFISQSIWDDTMAYQILEKQKDIPDHVIVVIVGDFHLAYGGGLPNRLQSRGAKKIHTISQVNLNGLSMEKIKSALQPSEKWGIRSDWIWISSF